MLDKLNGAGTNNGIWAGTPGDNKKAVEGIARSAFANGTAKTVAKPKNWERYPGYDISKPGSSLRETAKVIAGEVYVEQSHWSKQYFHVGRFIP